MFLGILNRVVIWGKELNLWVVSSRLHQWIDPVGRDLKRSPALPLEERQVN